jgi:hypothetical protein
MGVEGGAFSAQSKTMPKASQFMQTILNSGFGTGARSSCDAFMLVIFLPKKQSRVAEYDAGGFCRGRSGWDNVRSHHVIAFA